MISINKKHYFYFVILLLLVTNKTAVCYSYNDMDRLLTDLLNTTRYNIMIRPLQNQSKAMQVNILQGIGNIESLEVANGDLRLFSYIIITWVDEYLTWNPSDYGGLSRISLQSTHIWTPSIALAKGENGGSVINPYFSPVFVYNTGFVMLTTGDYYLTKCNIDTYLFPFDKHTCLFSFMATSHNADELILGTLKPNIDTDSYEQNEEWALTSTHSESVVNINRPTGIGISSVQNYVIVEMRPNFELINSLFPIFLLSALNMFTCFVPPDSGERMSVVLTLYLSFIFATTTLIDRMPHNAIKIAMMSFIVLSLNVLNTAGVVWGVLMVRVCRWQVESKPINSTLVKLGMWTKGKSSTCRSIKVHSKDQRSNKPDELKVIDFQNVDDNESNLQSEFKQQTDVLHVTWIDVVMFLDKVFFFILLCFVCIIFMIMFYNWYK